MSTKYLFIFICALASSCASVPHEEPKAAEQRCDDGSERKRLLEEQAAKREISRARCVENEVGQRLVSVAKLTREEFEDIWQKCFLASLNEVPS